ncbi:hypothetical protein [Pseudonocardia sp. TRM90224]|uniref:hypothetical protein n=1 Tax=Pseudonocardia sp. TRM90224 TaxID=2812678 RepID=UPI001E5E87C1|nr:hypothetical protein [Pseudonocardia sp. TRM90224]
MTARGLRVLIALLAVVLVAVLVVAWTTAGTRLRGKPIQVPAQGVGDSTVAMSLYAAKHPRADEVRRQLQEHFDAINGRNYAAWRATVVPERATALSEGDFAKDYASTSDGSIYIERIDDLPTGAMLVRVRFISSQDLANAPVDVQATRICWRNTLPMDGTPPRIGVTQGGSSRKAPC